MAPYSQSQKLPRAPQEPQWETAEKRVGDDLTKLIQKLKAAGQGAAYGGALGHEDQAAGALAAAGWAEMMANNPELRKLTPGDQQAEFAKIYEQAKEQVRSGRESAMRTNPNAFEFGKTYTPTGAGMSAMDAAKRGDIQGASENAMYALSPALGPIAAGLARGVKVAGAVPRLATAAGLGGLGAASVGEATAAPRLTREQQQQQLIEDAASKRRAAEGKAASDAEAARIAAEAKAKAEADVLRENARIEAETKAKGAEKAQALEEERAKFTLGQEKQRAGSETPFRVAHPYLSALAPWLGIAASGILPYSVRRGGSIAREQFAKEWEKYIPEAEKVIKGGDKAKSQHAINTLQDLAKQGQKFEEKEHPKILHNLPWLTFPAEGALIPDEMDYFTIPEDSPKHPGGLDLLKDLATRGVLNAGLGGVGALKTGLSWPVPQKSFAVPQAKSVAMERTFGKQNKSLPIPTAPKKGPSKPKGVATKPVPAGTPGMPDVIPMTRGTARARAASNTAPAAPAVASPMGPAMSPEEFASHMERYKAASAPKPATAPIVPPEPQQAGAATPPAPGMNWMNVPPPSSKP